MVTSVNRIGPVVAACLMLLPTALHAQATRQPKPVQFTTDLGFVSASGNSDFSTFNLGDKLTLLRGHWEHRQAFGTVYGITGDSETTNVIFVNWRTNYKFTERASVFVYGGFDRNRFAGVAHRFEETLGLSWKIIVDGGQSWSLEAGAGMTQQQGDDGASDAFASGRTETEYRKNFAEDSYVYQKVEYLPNLEAQNDYRLNSETGLVAPLSEHLAMKIGYVVRFDNIPEPTKRKSDRILTTGLQLNF